MRRYSQWTLLLVALSTCVPLFAATPADFYVDLLKRGVVEVEAGRNENAVVPLRLAAFGLIDSVEHYQTAQAYLVVALDRLNQPDAAREAANRLIAAEQVERKFASLRLPEGIRSAFTTSAKKVLPAADLDLLTTPSSAAPRPAPPQPQPQTQPQTPAKVPQQDAPKPKAAETKPAPQPSKPVETKPVVKSPSRPVDEKPATTTTTTAPATTAPATTTSSSTTRRPDDSTTPPTTKPVPKPTPPAPKPAQVQPAKPAVDVPARLTAGDRALAGANLPEARKIYRELLDAGGHDHATWIRVAEGLYRSRDFTGALSAFQSVGPLRPGEEAYRYYIAVASYETGQYDRAKRELAGALPYIEITPDVQRYRAKIDGAQ